MDDFYEGLCDAQLLALKEATEQIRELRADNKRLRAELAERDPDLWALSEELQGAQMKLFSAGIQP